MFDGEPDAVVSYIVLVRFFADVDPECLKLANYLQWQEKNEPNGRNNREGSSTMSQGQHEQNSAKKRHINPKQRGSYQLLSNNKLKRLTRNPIHTQPKPINISPITAPQIANKHPPIPIAEDLGMVTAEDLCIKEEVIEFCGRLRVDDAAYADGRDVRRGNQD